MYPKPTGQTLSRELRRAFLESSTPNPSSGGVSGILLMGTTTSGRMGRQHPRLRPATPIMSQGRCFSGTCSVQGIDHQVLAFVVSVLSWRRQLTIQTCECGQMRSDVICHCASPAGLRCLDHTA
jgi:hypothetical protein